MRSNRPSRWIAPLALLAAVAAVFIVISGSTSDSDGGSEGSAPSAEQTETSGRTTGEEDEEGETTARTSTTPERRRYRVRPGDTLALISERTGVSVEELQELNPDIDPNSLTVGDKLRLTE